MPIPNKHILTLTSARKFEILKFIQSFEMQANVGMLVNNQP